MRLWLDFCVPFAGRYSFYIRLEPELEYDLIQGGNLRCDL